MRARHYSLRTEEAYLHWIRRFILFHDKRHLREMGAKEVQQFLTDLALTHHVAPSTQNQALSALVFLDKVVFHQDIGWLEDVVRAKKPKRLPVVLSRAEVKELLQYVNGPAWLMTSLLYGGGFRLMECLRLRVKDIDFAYHQITVRNGKGAQDRITMLPESIREPLQRHLSDVQLLHTRDLEEGHGSVYLPYALERKYPNASREWVWQYAFPAATRALDPRSGLERRHHVAQSPYNGLSKLPCGGRAFQRPPLVIRCAIVSPRISWNRGRTFGKGRGLKVLFDGPLVVSKMGREGFDRPPVLA
jgi:integron integrase